MQLTKENVIDWGDFAWGYVFSLAIVLAIGLFSSNNVVHNAMGFTIGYVIGLAIIYAYTLFHDVSDG